ncbi:ATP-dependent Clp protease proteolytic subunit 5 [Castilleja foliolosa]|uniref:ATP-dependent Clp protease proteolytic subunit 5 n=1 Tax=Castilleja foliolosa TaxID=1961234 RepID=A0ABD3DTM1_9LAMI
MCLRVGYCTFFVMPRKRKFDCSVPEFGESSRSCRKLKSSNLRSCSVKAIYAPVNSLRSGIWSIREDLQVPSSPYFPAYAQAQGPPPMVQERFMSVISQHMIIRCGGAVDDDMANIIVSQLLYLDAVDPTKIFRDIRERHKSGVIEISVLSKWISKGKKEELCYQFIYTYGDCIEATADHNYI